MVKLTEFFCFDDILLIMFLYSFVVSVPREGNVPLTMSDLDFMQSTMASPFSIDKKQLTMYQKQSFLMAASAKSIYGSQTFSATVHQPGSNAVHIPNQNWGSIGHQVPRMMMPVADPQKYMQV